MHLPSKSYDTIQAANCQVNVRNWLARAISGGECSLESSLLPADLLAFAQQEGVVAMAEWRIRESMQGSGRALDVDPIVQSFEAASRVDALLSMLLEAETRTVLKVMAQSAVPGLLLKGSALAYWAYPSPHLRACGDVDVLLPSRNAAEKVASGLCAVGLERSNTSGDLVSYELMCRRRVSNELQLEVDIHWRLANSPLFANVFTFDELMADSVALPNLAPNARGLGPVHALVHACVHRALNLSIGVSDKLKWQYDLELLRAKFTPADWRRRVDISIKKGLAGVVRDAIENAAQTFESQLPQEWTTTLASAESTEILDARRISDWHYMQSMTFKSLPTPFLKLRWLWQRLFPSLDYLRYLYGTQHKSYCNLIFLRVRRMLKR